MRNSDKNPPPGVEKSRLKIENRRKVLDFLTPFEVVPFTDSMSETYARIKAGCEKKGEPVGPNDLLIAATVLALNGRLVTRNVREFRWIPGLEVIEW